MNWLAMLSEVHKVAWKVWAEKLAQTKLYKLSPERIQNGGVIPPAVVEELKIEIAGIPPKKQYHPRGKASSAAPVSKKEKKKKKKKEKKEKKKKKKKKKDDDDDSLSSDLSL